ncbi:MAG: prephenate dehydrogenase/arogenate dehydrogenase family protein [Planctomycetota bacterium]|nr:prephenate dehydrogenase/arogenate dehydrogenase family protein [Planctomycetota bacterium]
MITFQKIAILGMGFMGASLASSVRRFGSPGVQIRGYDPLEGRSAWSQSAGIVDQVFSNIADTVQGADLIVSAAPVDHIVSTLVEASLYAKHGAIFTDMGSTRERIETTLLKEFSAGVSHAGSHPMAGSEKTGPESNKDILFVGKWVFLTPGTASIPALDTLENFWKQLGANVARMGAKEHDSIVAYTSHLPHLAAFALAQTLPQKWEDFVAGGFRDTTRIASGLSEIWTPIFDTNRPGVLEALDQYLVILQQWRNALGEAGTQAIEVLVRKANESRQRLN